MAKNLTTSSSRRLISDAQLGDDDAIHRFCTKYWALVESWARNYQLDGSAPEDVAQSVLMRVVPNIQQYDPAKGRFRSWLGTITRNCALDVMKDRGLQVEKFFGDLDELGGLVGSVFSTDDLDSEVEELKEDAAIVVDSVREQFDEEVWYCLSGMVELGLTAQEIGENLGISPEAVRARKSRVLKKLRLIFSDSETNEA